MAVVPLGAPVYAEETETFSASELVESRENAESESILHEESKMDAPETEADMETTSEETEDVEEETKEPVCLETESVEETVIETAEKTEENLEANYGNTAKSFVYRLYKLVLGREPDTKGLNEWTNYLTSGQKTGVEVADGFIYSKELTARKLSDSAYVEMLYKTFLNRSSDSSGKKCWMTRLEKGMSRAFVYRGFANSTEFQGLCKQYGIRSGEVVLTAPKDQNEGVTMFIYRCYQKFLNRKPDDAGLNDWCNRLLSGQVNAKEAAYGFVMSNEFQNKNMSNTNYIKTIYLGLFDRTADSTGLSEWVGKLEAGNTRESVFYGFADSQEFRKLAKSFGLSSSWESTPVTYKMSKTDFIQVLLDNEDVWRLEDDKINVSNTSRQITPGYSLVDLDLDGTLELIVSFADGSNKDTPVIVYRVENKRLIQVGTCVDNGEDVFIYNLSLNQNKKTGEYVYMSNYMTSSCLSYIDIRYDANSVEKYSRLWSGYATSNGKKEFIYKVNGQRVSEVYYGEVLNSFIGYWNNKNLKKGYIANKDWVKYSVIEKTNALYVLYDSFSYGK